MSLVHVGWLLRVAPEVAAVEPGMLDAALTTAITRGRDAWPQLAVDDEAFVGAIARGIREAPEPVVAISELALEDLYLAQACATGAQLALEAFATTCTPTLAGSLRQMGLAGHVIDELSQEVQAKLFVGTPPRIATYTGRAALRSWVRTVATRAAVDRLRKPETAALEDEHVDRMIDPGRGPDLEYFRATYRLEFKQAFEEALATLDVRERNLLRHHFVDELTTEQIGTLYGVHKTTAFRWLEAARTALSKRTRAGFQQRLKLLPGELDSILAMLQSQIDLSLSRVLAAG
jgi:RNA polymerase sigma-70 factor (ECF subfamily)